jgi:myo-inositol-1(or 4)-monophosphatase
MNGPSELRELACDLAVAAGDVAAAGRRADLDAAGPEGGDDRHGVLGAVTKSSATDVVTRHDRAAEQVIVEGLLARRPDDAIVGEEGANRLGTSGLSWYVDPIDGTTNFMYGLPMWSTSVAVRDADGTVAGAVYVPDTAELFTAARGGGATRNGRPIRASGQASLALTLVATGFGYQPEERDRQARRFARLARFVRDIRRTGSAAIDLAYTAAGFFDAFYEENLNWWDMAAGELIARESGCSSGDFHGGAASPRELLVAAPGVFGELQALLQATSSTG